MDRVFLQHFGFLHKKALLQSSNRITNMFFAQRVLCESRGLLTKQRSGLIICILPSLMDVLNYILSNYRCTESKLRKWNVINNWQMTYPKRLLLKMRRRKDFIQLKVSLKDIIWSLLVEMWEGSHFLFAKL